MTTHTNHHHPTRNGSGGTNHHRRRNIMNHTTTTMCPKPSHILIHVIMISLILMVLVTIIPILVVPLLPINRHPTSTVTTTTMSVVTPKSYSIVESLSAFTHQSPSTTTTRTTTISSTTLIVNTVQDNPLLRIIAAAGISLSSDHDSHNNNNTNNSNTNTNNITNSLPQVYTAMMEQYGNDLSVPIVHGMERCTTYQQMVPIVEQRITAVAGMFNTGTNAMEYHLRENLNMIQSVWQVPWGKHRVPYVRLHHIAPGMNAIRQEHVLPIILIRDPFHWMQSMCQSPYAAHWKKTRLHCPNLVPTLHDIEKFRNDGIRTTSDTFNVTVHFDTNQILHWQSLIHLYNDWYQQYYTEATYPRLIIRFEDMLLHAPTIVRMIGTCVGIDNVTLNATPFHYQIQSAKGHGSHTDFVKAILKSGNVVARTRNMTQEDVQFAISHLDPQLMKAMHYNMPSIQ